MNTSLTRYSTALLPLAVLVLGVLDAVQKTGVALWAWQTIVQIVILLATTGLAFWLPLVPGPWAGAAKTGAAIVGAIASAAVATIPAGGHFTTATLILFLTAAIKAVAVQIGVSIRTDAEPSIDTTGTAPGDVPVITTLDGSTDDGSLEEIEPAGDEVGVDEAEQPAGADITAKHVATS